jgi:hypothetical protein
MFSPSTGVNNNNNNNNNNNSFCGPMVRVSGSSFRGFVFDFRRYQIFSVVVVQERGPLSLVMINEGLLERKI